MKGGGGLFCVACGVALPAGGPFGGGLFDGLPVGGHFAGAFGATFGLFLVDFGALGPWDLGGFEACCVAWRGTAVHSVAYRGVM